MSSSSSSSSFENWNFIKPLVFGYSATNGGTVFNRLAQTIPLTSNTINITKTFCYLYGPYGSSPSFTINVGIYTCDDQGKPVSQIAISSMDGDEITGNGWYEFDFSMVPYILPNNSVSIVMWQTGGDENNYALWGYTDQKEISLSQSFISNDDITWSPVNDIVFGIKVIENSSVLFDLANHNILTLPASELQFTTNLTTLNTNATYDQTILSNGQISIDPPNLMISLVMDASGSMGWNDRFGTRMDFANAFSNAFASYSGDVLFDVVKFGGSQIASSNASQYGTVMRINLDARNPSRSVYVLEANSATVILNDIYENNGMQYTVLRDANSSSLISVMGAEDPLVPGIMTLVSGSGDAQIEFVSFSKITVDNSTIIAYGFKNLIDGRTYNIGSVQMDGSDILSPDAPNWRMFYPIGQSPQMSLGNNGPNDDETLDIVASSNVVVRCPTITQAITYANLTSNVSIGDSNVYVDNNSSFVINEKIDLVDGSNVDFALNVSNVSNVISSITLSSNATSNIMDGINDGGVATESSVYSTFSFTGTTIMLLVRDASSIPSETATFFFQTTDGYMIEWDFNPLPMWYIYNFNWLGETAFLPVVLKDPSGNPFPDGTEIDFEVDKASDNVESSVTSHAASQSSPVGSNTIYVSSASGFTQGMKVNLIDKTHCQANTINSIYEEVDDYRITLFSPLTFDFNPANGAIISAATTATTASLSSEVAAVPLSVINVTTIFSNSYASNVQSYDLPQIPPSTSYEELNSMEASIKNGGHDVPTISGNAVLRILPITEDIIKTVKEENDASQNQLTMGPPIVRVNQSEQNSGDIDSINSSNSISTIVTGSDYTIISPVFLEAGEAQSSMTSSATEFEEITLDGLVLPGSSGDSVLAKTYKIYPSVVEKTEAGTQIAKQYLNSFDSYFAPEYYISSQGDGQNVSYWKPTFSQGCPNVLEGYEQVGMPGIYVSSGNSFTINYVVTDKFTLLQNGQLTVRFYANTVQDLEEFAASLSDASNASNMAINVKYPPITTNANGVQTVTQQYSEIDTWRNAVNANPASQLQTSIYTTPSSDPSSQDITAYTSSLVGVTGQSNASSSSKSLFYINPSQWVQATMLPSVSVTINIVNGHASVTIPASDTIALLFVEASYSFGNGTYETVRGDYVFFANPLNVSPIDPYLITPLDNITSYDIGATVTWMGDPIGINTPVVLYSITPLNPSISITENGIARGMLIGPHEVVYNPPIDANSLEGEACPAQVVEKVSVKVNSSLGFNYTCNRLIGWQPIDNNQNLDLGIKSFAFSVDTTGTGDGWADGNSGSTITVDLHDGNNSIDQREIPYNIGSQDSPTWATLYYYAGGDIVESGAFAGMPIQALQSSMIVEPNKIFGPNTDPVTFQSTPFNMNIGFEIPKDCFGTVGYPWNQSVDLLTMYKNPDGTFVHGRATTCEPTISPIDGSLILCPPAFHYVEPLGVTFSSFAIEDIDGIFVRDGVHSPTVVLDMTWEGDIIKNSFANPFPTVTFTSGVCTKTNSRNIGCPDSTTVSVAIDSRTPFGACLVMKNDPDVQLTTYQTQAGLFRTSIYTNVSSHAHSTLVDDYGNGQINSTISLTNVATNAHSHVISGFVVQPNDGSNFEVHTHTLRTVAITQLLPTSNQTVDISINGYVPYDPTHASPSNIVTTYYPYPQGCNRLMYNTLSIPHDPAIIVPPNLFVDLQLASNLSSGNSSGAITGGGNAAAVFYTAETPFDTDKGFDIRAFAYFSNGSSQSIQAVPDGSRITFDIETYKPESSSKTSANITSPDKIKDYLDIVVNAMASSNGQTATATGKIKISSSLQWVPIVEGLLVEPTSESIYLANVVSSIGSIGSSQIYDAVRMSAQRQIDFRTSNVAFANYSGMIVLLSDGDENSSQYSMDQAIEEVSAINGAEKTPIIPIRLGEGYISNEITMQQFAVGTDGIVKQANNLDLVDVAKVVSEILSSEAMNFNQGTYDVVLNSDLPGLPLSYYLQNMVVPVGSQLQYRVRTSLNGNSWGAWTLWTDYATISTATETIENLSVYYEYEVKFIMNSSFQSPVLTEGLSVDYTQPQETNVFFNPITFNMDNDQYLSSVHINHQANVAATSTVQYGITQSNSVDPDDYLMNGFSYEADRQEILLSRYNEPLRTKDYIHYMAVNGRWPSESQVQVYKIVNGFNGKIVPSSSYTVNSTNGTIGFISKQSANDKFCICISVEPVLRFICRITNYGSETTAIHNISLIYNVMKRIPYQDGSVVNKTIDMRIG